MDQTLYRRPLPENAIPFASAEGRLVFAEALAAGGLDGYFPLAEQFHTQAEPAFCGLGSLVVALNALAIDPGRLWKGPWRWFAEDLLDCCVPLETVRTRGIDLDELSCLARCNGAETEVQHADAADLPTWRTAIMKAARGEAVVIAAYDRAAMGQTGSGHFSPIAGYHAARDLVLLLDVARFKYPPHWVSAERLWRAMLPADPLTGRSRGWTALRPRTRGVALGFTIRCAGEGWQGFAQRVSATVRELASAESLADLAIAILPLTSALELRIPSAAAHRDALAAMNDALRRVPAYARIEQAVGQERAQAVTLLLLAVSDQLTAEQRAELGTLASAPGDQSGLAAELDGLRAQLVALAAHGH
jgi:glutathione gamma-glutamylcysteinyltransferase